MQNGATPHEDTLPGQGRSGRAGTSPRCLRCAMHLRLCLCDRIEPLDLRTRVVVISHQREVCKPTNTGRLVPLALVRGEVRVRGRRASPWRRATCGPPTG